MITTIKESDYGLLLEIKPETHSEVSKLARYALNANSEKPQVYLSFYQEPYLNISLSKRKNKVQVKSISNY